ncbi:hypothetical protein TNCV_3426771 [Trichonephila clavipes]|nr:hypothetical protein TNCV_3426771 [Trichonephila clavipes]
MCKNGDDDFNSDVICDNGNDESFSKHDLTARAKSHCTQPHANYQCFSGNVWPSILGDYLIRPSHLDSQACLIFLQHVLPELLDVATLHVVLERRGFSALRRTRKTPQYSLDSGG